MFQSIKWKGEANRIVRIVFFLNLVLIVLLAFQWERMFNGYMFYSTLSSEEVIVGDRTFLYGKVIFQMIVSFVKVAIFVWLLVMLYLGRLLQYRNFLKIAIIVFVIFLCFDLPIWPCYNGKLETLWHLGGHLH